MSIQPDETLITGSWELIDGRMVADDQVSRIRSLVGCELEWIAASASGWETLYKDPSDGRFWELFLPQSEMHGGGPESLRVLDAKAVRTKYGISLGS